MPTSSLLRGTRSVDWVLAGALSALGLVLMVMNLRVREEEVAAQVASGAMVHALSPLGWPVVPAFLLATVPVLWWRRDAAMATAVSLVAMAAHVGVFGWVTRCGAGLPLAFVLAFLGAVGQERRRALASLVLSLTLTVAVGVRDATTGLEVVVLAGPIVLIVWWVGRVVRQRTTLTRELRARTAELQALREDRAEIEVADTRARLSVQLDGLLQERLGQLTAAAESGRDLGGVAARDLLAQIEDESRRTLDDMREVVGLLRGGDVALAPVPTVAHLEALLARHRAGGSTLTVDGLPRSLPAAVELTAYRIVELLVTALADDPALPVVVGVRFLDDALEISVGGPAPGGARLRTAVERARERARLLGGSLEVRVDRRRAETFVALPAVA